MKVHPGIRDVAMGTCTASTATAIPKLLYGHFDPPIRPLQPLQIGRRRTSSTNTLDTNPPTVTSFRTHTQENNHAVTQVRGSAPYHISKTTHLNLPLSDPVNTLRHCILAAATRHMFIYR